MISMTWTLLMPVISESQVPTSTRRTPGESSSPSFGPYAGTISAAPAGVAKANRGVAAATVRPSAIADLRFKSSINPSLVSDVHVHTLWLHHSEVTHVS